MTRSIEHSELAKKFRDLRLILKVSQTKLARKSGVALATIRLAEVSGGRLITFEKLLLELGHSIKGQSLPAGKNLGSKLKVLRQRQGLSLRQLSSMAGVSVPTVLNIENGKDCYLINLEAVAKALDARIFLHPVDKPLSFYHGGLSNSSNCSTWTTPSWVLERLYPIVNGEFCLDPCSPTNNKKNAPVKADKYYTGKQGDCGLTLPWIGNVFVNPPYGKELVKWVKKCDFEFNSGRTNSIIAILPLRSDVKYWQELIANKTSILFFQGRLQFGSDAPNCGKAPFSTTLVIWCNNKFFLNEVKEAFSEHWFVYPAKYQ